MQQRLARDSSTGGASLSARVGGVRDVPCVHHGSHAAGRAPGPAGIFRVEVKRLSRPPKVLMLCCRRQVDLLVPVRR